MGADDCDAELCCGSGQCSGVFDLLWSHVCSAVAFVGCRIGVGRGLIVLRSGLKQIFLSKERIILCWRVKLRPRCMTYNNLLETLRKLELDYVLHRLTDTTHSQDIAANPQKDSDRYARPSIYIYMYMNECMIICGACY